MYFGWVFVFIDHYLVYLKWVFLYFLKSNVLKVGFGKILMYLERVFYSYVVRFSWVGAVRVRVIREVPQKVTVHAVAI